MRSTRLFLLTVLLVGAVSVVPAAAVPITLSPHWLRLGDAGRCRVRGTRTPGLYHYRRWQHGQHHLVWGAVSIQRQHHGFHRDHGSGVLRLHHSDALL